MTAATACMRACVLSPAPPRWRLQRCQRVIIGHTSQRSVWWVAIGKVKHHSLRITHTETHSLVIKPLQDTLTPQSVNDTGRMWEFHCLTTQSLCNTTTWWWRRALYAAQAWRWRYLQKAAAWRTFLNTWQTPQATTGHLCCRARPGCV